MLDTLLREPHKSREDRILLFAFAQLTTHPQFAGKTPWEVWDWLNANLGDLWQDDEVGFEQASAIQI